MFNDCCLERFYVIFTAPKIKDEGNLNLNGYMGKKLFTLLLSVIVFGTYAQTRPGSLKGTVTDAKTGETVPFANVVIKDNSGAVVTGGTTDFDGKFNINPIAPNTYNVEVSFTGYATIKLTDINIGPNSPTVKDFKMRVASAELSEVVIVYEAPLIDKTKSSTNISAEDILNMAVRSPGAIAAQAAGATQDANGNINIRGARGEGTVYFIDGVKVRGSVNLPQAAIQSTEIITGGLPAQYGDAVGGVINTTTRGPSGTFFGNAEILSSSLFDDYDYNLAAVTYGGPLWKNAKGQPIVGFLFSAEFEYSGEPRPTNIPYVEVDSDVLTDLENNPLSVNPSGQNVFYRSEFVTEDQLSDAQSRKNTYSNQLRLNGNVQIKTSRTTNLTLGGRWIYSDDKVGSYFNHIFNYNTNADQLASDWSAYARFQQQFGASSDDTKSLIKNAFYNIQVDYSRNIRETSDGRYGEDFFKYGHVGSFDLQTFPIYVFGTDTSSGVQGWRFVGDAPIGVSFQQGPNNTVRGNYTSQYFDLATQNPGLIPNTIEELIGNNIPINGTSPRSVYGRWGSAGAAQTNYSKSQNSQFRVTASTNFDIKDHSLIVGIEYEQRSDRAYSLSANGLWTQMRLLQNRPNQQLDLANPIFVNDANGVFQDTIRYNFLYSPNDASSFAENVRVALGKDPFDTETINVLNLDPSLFSLDFFSADELINPGGTGYVSYYGYDYTGNILSSQPTTADFFTETDDNGNLSRPVGAFQPIYIAGYIQDQFTYNDLTFNVGVRIDRFDLNQEVLKDPFVLFPTYSVKDLASTELSREAIDAVPSSVGGDYVVYLNSFDYGSATIVGYRDPETNDWFDANGDPLIDPQDLSDAANGGIKPFLVTPPTAGDSTANNVLTSESFKDYAPQTVVMPRIAFNFPITDEALFIAHYDVLAQRPTTGISRLNPFSYLDLLNNDNGTRLNNPDLKPQKTTEYELGFKQTLTERSALKISAFYRELRDLLQTTSFTQAYPITYVAYGNLDFGTVKGFSLEYELRRTNNVKLDANYTLQFADGTGSSTTSGANLAAVGQPNLRYILPLSYDRRHQILVRFDYRYGRGARYNGPVWWNSRVFAGAGLNITVNALSGEPYTKRVDFRNNAQIEGQINGARLPWQITFDARLNKVFGFKNGKSIEVYIQALNVLDTENITNVYDFTGSPTDDGFLSSATAAAQISQQANAQSYVDLYNRSIRSPFNFALPRRVRLGISYNF